MKKCKLRNVGRPKAGFGEAAAILTAAGINVAGTLAAAKIGADAAKAQAKSQADAAIRAARMNKDAIREQNENSNQLQLDSQEFTKDQNEQNRQLQRDVQMNLQLLTGQQSMNDRKEASKIQLKRGGSIRRRLGLPYPSLRGNNFGFTVTDGGGVIPIGVTIDGNNLYEIVGNDHEHYHKTRSGKNKTGVGFKFENGTEIEGEGNQNTNNGELLLTTPDNAYFISKHSIKGFNPAEAVRNGMEPEDAYNTQEILKNGNVSTPVKKRRIRLAGGTVEDIMATDYPQGLDYSTDTINPTVVGVVYGSQIPTKEELDSIKYAKRGGKVRSLRLGGRVKAANGTRVWSWGTPTTVNVDGVNWGSPAGWVNPQIPTITPPYDYNYNTNVVSSTPSTGQTVTPNTNRGRFSLGYNTLNYIGSGISTLGNIGGALITQAGNNKAASLLSDAYIQAGNIVADAYRNMRGVDMKNIRREDFSAEHYMPAVRSAYYNVNPQLNLVERSLSRNRDMIKRNSLSSAAMLNRLNLAEINAQDSRNQLYGEKGNREEAIRQSNIELINRAAEKNAELDIQANRDYTAAYLDLLKYNNGVRNASIAGVAEALSGALTQGANVRGSAIANNVNGWASAITNSAGSFANTLSTIAARNSDLAQIRLGASGDSQANYYGNANLSSNSEAIRAYNSYLAQYETAKNQNDIQQMNIAKRRANTIAAGRGWNDRILS